MGLFNKEVICEKCGKLMLKKERAVYDTTQEGDNNKGQVLKVCHSCLMEMFFRDLREFDESLVVVGAVKKFNAYVCYHFDRLLNVKGTSKMDEDNNKLVDDMKALFPPDGTKCSRCDKKAVHTWCSFGLLNNDPFTWEVNKEAVSEYLCSECLIEVFQKKLEEEDIELKIIYPPIKGLGFMCSWEI